MSPTVSHQRLPYLNSRWRALFPGGGGRQGGGGLNKGGGHLWWHRCSGACRTPAGWHVAHQPHAAVHLNVGVPLGGHIENFEAIIVEAGELALVGPLPVIPANGDSGLGVEDCQLPAWCIRKGMVLVEMQAKGISSIYILSAVDYHKKLMHQEEHFYCKIDAVIENEYKC